MKREGASFWAILSQLGVSGHNTLNATSSQTKASFFCPGPAYQMRERSTTAPCSHLVGPNNSTGHVFLEISSRNYDHKQSYKSDWHSGPSCETGLIPEGRLCPPLSWQETPLGRAVNCHQVAQTGAMQESRKTDPQLNPLNSGNTRDDMKPASPHFLINVVNI